MEATYIAERKQSLLRHMMKYGRHAASTDLRVETLSVRSRCLQYVAPADDKREAGNNILNIQSTHKNDPYAELSRIQPLQEIGLSK
jgi:hypothetical protein